MKSKRTPFDPKSFLAKIGEGRTISAYSKNQPVFAQGDPSDALFYIQKGKVKLAVVSRHGKEAIVGIFGPADFFGEGCLAGQLKRMATASALSDCSIVRIGKPAAIKVIRKEPLFS